MKRILPLCIFQILLVMALLAQGARAEPPAIDSSATGILKRMTEYLGGVQQFSVQTQNTLEDLIASGHRVDLDVSAKVIVSRPNKIRSERKGEQIDQIFYYNGKSLTLFNPDHNVYSTMEAPDTFYGLFTVLYESLGFGLPISDLVHADAFPLLMDGVTFGQVVGKTHIDGVRCDHLLFSRPGVDFQLWVAEGERPLPLKYVVTDTATPAHLSVSARLSDWDLAPNVDESTFTFIKPNGAQSINFILF